MRLHTVPRGDTAWGFWICEGQASTGGRIQFRGLRPGAADPRLLPDFGQNSVRIFSVFLPFPAPFRARRPLSQPPRGARRGGASDRPVLSSGRCDLTPFMAKKHFLKVSIFFRFGLDFCRIRPVLPFSVPISGVLVRFQSLSWRFSEYFHFFTVSQRMRARADFSPSGSYQTSFGTAHLARHNFWVFSI